MKWLFLFLIFFITYISSVSEARVFSLKKAGVLTYLRAGFGLNKLQKTAFQPGFPTTGATTTTFPDHNGVNQDYDGEIGFGYRSNKITTKLGLGLVYPQVVTSEAGRDISGTQTMTLTSQVFSLVPKVAIEYALRESDDFKIYMGGAIGYTMTTLKNTVALNTSGQALFPTAAANYTEEATGYGISGEGYVGLAFACFDNVVFNLDGGYRYLTVGTFNLNRDASTVRGSVTAGSTLKNVDGTNRVIDLSGVFLAGTFTIYLQ